MKASTKESVLMWGLVVSAAVGAVVLSGGFMYLLYTIIIIPNG